MVERLAFATSIAALGFLAATRVAGAARSPHLAAVAIGTFLVALGLMLFLSIIYAIKLAAGIEKPLPPPPPEETGAGHH